MKFIIGFGAILAVGIPTFVVGQYVSDLRHDMESSKAEVEHLKGQISQLQDILEKAQTTSASGSRGPKGDQGPVGPQGERGPEGPKGEPGTPVDVAQLSSTIEKLLSGKLANLPQTARLNTSSSIISTGAFDTENCIAAEKLKGAETITLRAGNEVCDATGRVLFKVKEINRYGRVTFVNPGERDGWCEPDKNCDINGDKYVYEREGSDDHGPVAMFRLSRM
jgi:hypothetical protein